MQEETLAVLQSAEPKMLFKTGLLVISNPKHIGKILPSLKKYVHNTLYIQLLSALTDPFGSFHPNLFNTWPKFSQTITGIYKQVSDLPDLDIRILISGLKYKNLEHIRTSRPIDLVIFDQKHPEKDIDNFMKCRIKNVAQGCTFLTTDSGPIEEPVVDPIEDTNVYKHSVLGGTFDQLHTAHKLLLTEASLRATDKITVGVTDENMLQNKTLWELIQPVEKRINAVKDFLEDVNSELITDVVRISDLYGPTKDDPTMNVIIVSSETVRGAYKINELRCNKGLEPLKIVTLDLIEEPHHFPNEETKISSSTCRIRSLGKLFRPIVPKYLPKKPYIIGLTGGICTGKSTIAQYLKELGAHIIDCDKFAHKLYVPGKPAHTKIIEEFGKDVLASNGEIDRRKLGTIVFKDPQQLQKLNSLLWPMMMVEIQEEIRNCKADVVVVEAAILLGAGWDKYCHEIWATILPPEVVIERLQKRNNLSLEEANRRLTAQMENKKYIDVANVIICSLWPVDYTRSQIDKAWQLLLKRISS
ncbi:hypothetical protein Trydic_g23865 [Trypoxylus dichotomus]